MQKFFGMLEKGRESSKKTAHKSFSIHVVVFRLICRHRCVVTNSARAFAITILGFNDLWKPMIAAMQIRDSDATWIDLEGMCNFGCAEHGEFNRQGKKQ